MMSNAVPDEYKRLFSLECSSYQSRGQSISSFICNISTPGEPEKKTNAWDEACAIFHHLEMQFQLISCLQKLVFSFLFTIKHWDNTAISPMYFYIIHESK